MEASPRLELGVRILQTLALPLGYDAVFNFLWSGRRDSDPRLSPWQGDTLPLSHSRRIDCLNNISKEVDFGNKFFNYFVLLKSFVAKSVNMSAFDSPLAMLVALSVSSFNISLTYSLPFSVTNDVSVPSSRRSSAN